MSREALSLPYWLVLYHGYYCKEKWETKKDRGLPAPKFPMQMGNTPHKLTIPGTIQTQKMVLDGVDDMKACTNNKVYWPGMNTSIHNFRANGPTCKYSPKPATGTHYHDSRMAIPTKFYPFTANPLHAASQMGSSCTKPQWTPPPLKHQNSRGFLPVVFLPKCAMLTCVNSFETEWVAAAQSRNDLLHHWNTKIVEMFLAVCVNMCVLTCDLLWDRMGSSCTKPQWTPPPLKHQNSRKVSCQCVLTCEFWDWMGSKIVERFLASVC